MKTKEDLELTYVALNLVDIHNAMVNGYINQNDIDVMDNMVKKVNEYRKSTGRKDLKGIVIEKDWKMVGKEIKNAFKNIWKFTIKETKHMSRSWRDG